MIITTRIIAITKRKPQKYMTDNYKNNNTDNLNDNDSNPKRDDDVIINNK